MTDSVSIEITKADFTRLQRYAEPLVDTPATALKRVLDRVEGSSELETPPPSEDLPTVFFEVPPMTHTKFLGGVIDGHAPDKNTWDAFLRLAFKIGKEKSGGFGELKRTSGANMVLEKKDVEGYKYDEYLGFSYQGVSTEDALSIVIRLTKSYQLMWRVEFEWRDKVGAAFPGRRATLGMAHDLVTGGIL
ncbi:MAG: hypothetical protein AAF890_09820 [Pseudomonadota bacterium]